MNWPEFKVKWSRYTGKESSAYQEHFNDLCRLLQQPTPAQADPTGEEFFCFQKRVVKDLELLPLDVPLDSEPGARGFADVWKKNCFGWEYKGKKKDLDEAYKQLQRYREALLNPPILVVCDFNRYIIRTNFNGTVQETYEFTNDQIDRPENLRVLRALFEDPGYLKPQRTTTQVTENLAAQIAEIARSLQARESVELSDAKTRKQVHVAQKKNLRIARFLNRIVFCLFAEDTGLLPQGIFADVAKLGLEDPTFFAERLEELFKLMARGGVFGTQKIRHFNGHLFEEATVFELTHDEIRQLADAAQADWRYIEPSIMGTLFERALDEDHRAQLGAHYTSEADIKTLVEPVLMQPLRQDWARLKTELAPLLAKGKGDKQGQDKLASFQAKLSSITVLDPACGSGNFLYVALQLLLGLEKEVITYAAQLGFSFKPQVNVKQLKAIEINPYAYELAQVSVQIGYLQWRRDNGFENDRNPVLQNLEGFENKDALLHETFKKRPKNLKEARKEEHAGQDELFKVYVEHAWPEADVIVGNPPFLGGSRIWEQLGKEYQKGLWDAFKDRVPGFADLCCYWFEKAREQIEQGGTLRAGLLATQAVRGGANRQVLKRIKETGDIFFAESDRVWTLDGANVHVSMVGFDGGLESRRILDGQQVACINSNLTSDTDLTLAKKLRSNLRIAFIGTKKAGAFNVDSQTAIEWLHSPNPHGRPNSDFLVPWLNGSAMVKRPEPQWIIDCGTDLTHDEFCKYSLLHSHVVSQVKPERAKNNRALYRSKWWLHAETRPGMRAATSILGHYIATARVAKHRVFAFIPKVVLADDGVFLFSREDFFFFGVIHSRVHELWALAQGTQLREKESGFRYTPTSCFETFPFPFPDDLTSPPTLQDSNIRPSVPDPAEAAMNAAKYYSIEERPVPYTTQPSDHRQAIAAAARELNALRERWLNPPEWTTTTTLEFPGTVGGPWSRYIDAATVVPSTSVGVVKYPRVGPRDSSCAAKLQKRTLTNLYNERPAWLDIAHKKLDAAVAAAYGWPADLPDGQILSRLLALNLERASQGRATEATRMQRP